MYDRKSRGRWNGIGALTPAAFASLSVALATIASALVLGLSYFIELELNRTVEEVAALPVWLAAALVWLSVIALLKWERAKIKEYAIYAAATRAFKTFWSSSPPQRSPQGPADPQGYYRILGLAPTATKSEIKSAYRWLVKKYHPDIDPNPRSAVLFRSITEAYSILSHQERRSRYDNKGGANSTIPLSDSQGKPGGPRRDAALHDGRLDSSFQRNRRPRNATTDKSTAWRSTLQWVFALLIGIGITMFFLYPLMHITRDTLQSAQPKYQSPVRSDAALAQDINVNLCSTLQRSRNVELLSSRPTAETVSYLEGLHSNKYSFSWAMNGFEAASQLGFGKRFTAVYAQMVEEAQLRMKLKGALNIAELIEYLESIVGEEKAVDALTLQREHHFSAIVYLRALQAGECSFPSLTRDTPPADEVLRQLRAAYPDLNLEPRSAVFSTIYNKIVKSGRSRISQAGSVSIYRTIEDWRRAILN